MITPGTRYVDVTGRTLVITAVDATNRQERHVQGTVLGRPYACSFAVFEAVWLAGALDEAGVLLSPPAQAVAAEQPTTHQQLTPLYAPDGKALPYSRRGG